MIGDHALDQLILAIVVSEVVSTMEEVERLLEQGLRALDLAKITMLSCVYPVVRREIG